MIITTYDAFTRLSTMDSMRLTDFLFEHLEDYATSKRAIFKSIQYATKEISGLGGYIFTAEEDGDFMGALIINKTGMGDFMAENHLVFIAVKKEFRNQGIGKKLLGTALQYCSGNISLHGKPDSRALNLFKSFGFKSEYLEMRFENLKEKTC